MTHPPIPPAPTGTPHWATHIVIPTLWTPEQALAVFELLDELRDTVATLYAEQLQAQLRHEQGGNDNDNATDGDTDTSAGDELTF